MIANSDSTVTSSSPVPLADGRRQRHPWIDASRPPAAPAGDRRLRRIDGTPAASPPVHGRPRRPRVAPRPHLQVAEQRPRLRVYRLGADRNELRERLRVDPVVVMNLADSAGLRRSRWDGHRAQVVALDQVQQQVEGLRGRSSGSCGAASTQNHVPGSTAGRVFRPFPLSCPLQTPPHSASARPRQRPRGDARIIDIGPRRSTIGRRH